MQIGLFNKTLIPFIAFVLFGTVSIALWQHQNNHDRELVLRHLETSVEQVRFRVEGLMKARLSSLALMADRWVERQPADFSRERFCRFAAALTRNYPGYSGIFWMDPSGVIQWAVPAGVEIASISMGLAKYSRPGNPVGFDNSQNEGDLEVIPCVRLPAGGWNFSAIRVLRYNDDLQGYLGGYFSVDQIMVLCLTKEILNDFYISVSEQSRTIYQHGESGQIRESKQIQDTLETPHAVREIRFGGKIWRIMLAPNQTSYPIGMRKNVAVLSFGLIVAATLSVLLHLLIRRMEMYKASRDQALFEVQERKQAQAALRDNEIKLQTLLAELTSKNAELESFVYTVSHDLKTPIVTIEGFIGALREDFSDKISSTSDQYLRHMSNAARKMELLINELLNYSRIGRLEETKTEFSMSIPVMEAIATLRPQIEALGITMNVQTDLPEVYADRKRIEQVIFNLLSNAVKYIDRHNAGPRIDIGCTQQNGQNVFYICDNGIGIDQKYFEKIFLIFERLPAAKSIGEGTGIGLAIVKRIIELHGGRIWLSSELGKGTTFYFTVKDKEMQ